MDPKPAPPARDSGIDSGREAWIHRCIVSGRQSEAVAWVESAGDFEAWTDRRGRTVAARVLNLLGANRAAALRHWRNLRQYPDDPVAIFHGAFAIHGRFGALAALDFLTERLANAGSRAQEDREFARIRAYLATVEGCFRDFSRARENLDRASALDPEDMWIEVQRSQLLLREDRPEESLEVAEAALESAPNFWPVIATVADRYWMENRDEEALALLRRAQETNEGPGASRSLAQCLDEIEEWEEGLAVLDEFEKRSPRADKETVTWLEGYRASFLYQLGRGEEMIPHAEIAGHHFYHQVVKRVKSGSFAGGRRVRLPVEFIRQNEMTCAPATLTALSRFFGREANHLEVAEEICYDGTPDYKERLWAEQEGWVVREFRADWDTTRRLIDAGFPFALATAEPTSAHLQAVIGYDSRAGTVIIRDPGFRHYQESLEEPFFKDYAQCGPRAMVLAPAEGAAALRAIDLPDEPEYDLVYRLNSALEVHDRDAAQACLEELATLSPGHRLLEHGRLILSGYDSDTRGGLESAKRMAERFPDSVRWEYLHYSRRVERMTREQRLDYLREKVRSQNVFTLYYKELADLLAEDARCQAEARYYYRRAVRFRGSDAEVYHGLASVMWSQRQFTRATQLYRLAACLADRNEAKAAAYFKASRRTRETEEALAMLRERVTRLGSASGGPAITLCQALSSLGREPEVATVLEEALRRTPADGALISFAADHFAGIRHPERARELVEQAAGRISETERLRLTARLAHLESRPEETLAAWRAVLERDPLAMDAHRAVARLLASTTGDDAKSIAHLRTACEMFPYHVPLHETLVDWLRAVGPGEAEPVLRQLLARHGSNAWAWRELALELSDQQRPEEGLAAAETAIELQPEVTWSYSVRACLHEDVREMAAATADFRRALELDVENGAAMRGLLRVSDGGDAKRDALRFIEGELATQVLFGETMHQFRNIAFAILEPDELLASLQRANHARPDLWETWSALTDQLVAMDRLDEALETATQLTERFPMMPRAWLDLADVCQHRSDADRHIQTLEQCVALNPQWTRARRKLADALGRRGDFEAAIAHLEQAVREEPQEAPNHGCLADLLWKTGRRDEAFEAVRKSARADPGYDWGWDTLGEWAVALDREEYAVAEGERLAETMPMHEHSWQRLANLHGCFERLEARLAALDRGLAALPHSEELRDHKAWVLCVEGRYEAAIGECRSDLWPAGRRPRTLAGREAWIENERGRHAEAIEKMAAVAAHHPDYYWAHEQLTRWYQRDQRWDEAQVQATHLVRLMPTECSSHGVLADLHLKRGDPEAALKSLERAFQLNPSYAYAGNQLTQLHLEAGRLDEAEATLSVFAFHHPENAIAIELRCRLELLRCRHEAATAAFAALCRLREVAPELLERVETEFLNAGKDCEILPVYTCAMGSGEVRSPGVARRWVACELARAKSGRTVEEALPALPLVPDVRDAAWQELIYGLERGGHHRRAVAIIRGNAGIYRDSVLLWGSAAYVFKQARRFREIRGWMSDWRERDGVRPWMLINLAFSELQLGGIAAAGPVHRHAATALAEDRDTWCHHAVAAYYEMWRGRLPEARTHLAKAETAELATLYRAICRLAEFRLEILEHARIDGARFRRAVEAFPAWAGDRNARIYFFDTFKGCWRELLFQSGSGLFALAQYLRAALRRPRS